MKIAYILFIAAVDVLIYVTLYNKIDKKRKISRSIWWLWAMAVGIIVCHAEVFKLKFLLPFDDFLTVLLWSLAIAAAYLISAFYVERFQEVNWNFMAVSQVFTSVVLCIFIFLGQCVIIVFAVERYYKQLP
jgi:hypothetical protein